MLASGESENVVGGEQVGKTAVVCDEGGGDTKVSSDLDDVDLLVKEACNIVKSNPTEVSKIKAIRTNSQYQEGRCEEKEQGGQAN
jgi:hypothetical protein